MSTNAGSNRPRPEYANSGPLGSAV
jgi:hypothetical protein